MFRFIELAILLLLVLMFFGTGKLPRVMGELGRGIANFKKGMDGQPLEKESENEVPALVSKPKKAGAKTKASTKKK